VVPPELFRQLGSITRLLRDTMQQPGVTPRLQVAADGLPDECSRLGCIANETAAAAEKVLKPVDQAKLDQAHIAASTRRMTEAIVADPGEAVAQGTAMNFVQDVVQTTARIDGHLTDILKAIVFHDLTLRWSPRS
jgi:chemotaxis protein CheZ